jgi:hypothetical protein
MLFVSSTLVNGREVTYVADYDEVGGGWKEVDLR